MKTFFKVIVGHLHIEEVYVEKETSQTIWMVGHAFSDRKRSSYNNYFETKQEAFNFIEKTISDKIISLENSLNKEKDKLKELNQTYPELSSKI